MQPRRRMCGARGITLTLLSALAATQITCGPTAHAGDDPVDATQPPNDVSQVPDADTECGEATFDVTETQEVFEVPPNVYYMHVKAWGSGGNGEGACTFDDGGIGGYSEAVFSVTPGDPLIIIVGAPGSASYQGDDVVRFGFGSSGGGGLSGVFKGPDFLDEHDADKAYIIAGGAGGAGYGPAGDTCRPGGTGNHPDGGGEDTMLGGVGLDSGVNGGGGGYDGGHGGALKEFGLGGSGYVSEADKAPDSDHLILHVEPGAGAPPKTDDADYDGAAGKTESGGLVVIHFVCSIPPVL